MSHASQLAPTSTTTAPGPHDAGGPVEVLAMADGLVVRLAGALGTEETGQLRAALLRTRPAACDDVLVDAGAVTSVADDALAVLVAATAWAAATGGALVYTDRSAPLVRAATRNDVLEAFPLLAAPGAR